MTIAVVLCLVTIAIVSVVYANDFGQDNYPARDIHFFFYAWYGTPDIDGAWKHWDHEVLPHWEPSVNEQYSTVGNRHSPPEHIHAPFYPLRNPYSSRDHTVLLGQFDDMLNAGGNVAVVSWWGQASKPYATDTQGVCTDKIMSDILNAADKHGRIRIAFHLEPYPSRTVESIKEDLSYIIRKYGHHPSLARSPTGLPIFYVYDSYHIYPSQWRRLLHHTGDITVRGTPLDGWFIGLWLNRFDGRDMNEGGFDGIYTYFATSGFSYGSSPQNWKSMCEYARSEDMLCILSVGPGYNDSLIRPWNTRNSRDRKDGQYYSDMWKKALLAQPSHVSITSFNEWGEGTQIEPAREVTNAEGIEDRGYLHYGARGPYYYLHRTLQHSYQLHKLPAYDYSGVKQRHLFYYESYGSDVKYEKVSAVEQANKSGQDGSASVGEETISLATNTSNSTVGSNETSTVGTYSIAANSSGFGFTDSVINSSEEDSSNLSNILVEEMDAVAETKADSEVDDIETEL
jgi:glycoprotein endo-alpha-1,2-mannosidase